MTDSSIVHGQLLLTAGSISSALKVAEQALASDPTDDSALSLMYDCLIEEEDYVKALDHAKHWVSRNPESDSAHDAFIYSCHLWESKQDCINAIQRYKSLFPQRVVNAKLFDYDYEIHWGSISKALKIMRNLRASNFDSYPYIKKQAQATLHANQFAKACALIQEGLSMQPDDADMWHFFAIASFKNMQYSQARKAAKECLRLKPSSRTMRQLIWLTYIVYFPLFLLAGFISWLLSKVVTSLGGSAGITLFVIVMISALLLSSLKEIGISHADTIFWLYLGWLVISEVMIDGQGVHGRKKNKPVKLSDY